MINPRIFGYGESVNSIYSARDASAAESTARSAKDDTHRLDDRLDRLSLVCLAMWSLIQDKTNVTEQDLLDRVKTLDLMDGVEDGKVTRTVAKCSKCDRVMSTRHRRCLYCGAGKLIESAFDTL